MVDYIQIISTVGFPIAMTFYLLFRFEKKIDDNTSVLQQLITYLQTRR